ncbi:hypothetical protein BDW02DRAFT_651428 [Decorospora gaudefroyi]|uniref:Uncharacterized protein n=1 Tax=Decorospora gaudefroyi TaxID=184978 RepID=A0A6A5JYS0_9PLEO|nr:hypothetical protein BDW02DRAFT_651428 [Decorospora gaudefroyi]
MSYEDIEAARAKRAMQEADKEAKGKRKADAATKEKKKRKKRKDANVTQEAEEVTVQTSEAHVAEESALLPYRALVARMYLTSGGWLACPLWLVYCHCIRLAIDAPPLSYRYCVAVYYLIASASSAASLALDGRRRRATEALNVVYRTPLVGGCKGARDV